MVQEDQTLFAHALGDAFRRPPSEAVRDAEENVKDDEFITARELADAAKKHSRHPMAWMTVGVAIVQRLDALLEIERERLRLDREALHLHRSAYRLGTRG